MLKQKALSQTDDPVFGPWVAAATALPGSWVVKRTDTEGNYQLVRSWFSDRVTQYPTLEAAASVADELNAA